MRKIVNSTYISLDGVIEAPHTWPPTGSDDPVAGQIQTDLILSCDALITGRHTYEGFAPVWPTRSGDPYSDHINTMRKYVVSSTLRDPEWENTTVIAGDPVEEIRRLKEEPGKDMVQYGFGQLSHAPMEHGLLDELRLWVHPLFVGEHGPDGLIHREGGAARLELRDTTPLTSGTVGPQVRCGVMIARIWRGAVRPDNADEYVDYIERTGMTEYRATPGNRGAWMLRRDVGGLTEIVTFSLWDSLDAVKAFAGEDFETAVFYPEDDRFLVERDETTRHYDVT